MDLLALARERVAPSGAATLERYLELLGRADGRVELGHLAGAVTIGETYFFRNAAQLAAFAEVMLPERLAAHAEELQLLSAGCSTGEEPYTLAILCRERLRRLAPGRRAAITAVDVSAASLERARRAVYSDWALRQVEPEVRAREFRRVEREWHLGPGPRELVTFEARNLVAEEPDLWRPGRFDVVFFRNVGMYFAPGVLRDVVARIARALRPGGFLVLGDAETLRGVSTDFDLCHTHDAFYYRRRASTRELPRPAPAPTPPGGVPRALADPPAPDEAWVDSIRGAHERIQALAERPRAAGAAPAPWDLAPVLELVRQDRLQEAHAALDALPAPARLDRDVRLLRAVVLTNRGLLAEAEAECVALLADDGLHAGARYLRALCREHQGDLAGAAEEDRAAAHLDPTFAMPRLHLALLARRRGAIAEAARDLAHAEDLLEREEPARILLFGGGFTRDALLAMCRRR